MPSFRLSATARVGVAVERHGFGRQSGRLPLGARPASQSRVRPHGHHCWGASSRRRARGCQRRHARAAGFPHHQGDEVPGFLRGVVAPLSPEWRVAAVSAFILLLIVERTQPRTPRSTFRPWCTKPRALRSAASSSVASSTPHPRSSRRRRRATWRTSWAGKRSSRCGPSTRRSTSPSARSWRFATSSCSSRSR